MAKYIELNGNFIKNPIAHRGLHSDTVSENSMEAFKLAMDKGYAIEIDVHLLKDGELAVVHDENLQRVTGKNVIIENLTSEELEDYPLLLSKEKIPTLKEFLDLINGRVPVLIELKAGSSFNPKLAENLLIELKDYPCKDMIALQSFNPYAVKYLKKYSEEYSVGLLATGKYEGFGKIKSYLLSKLKLYNNSHADFLSYDIDYLPNRATSRKRKKGYKLLAWTVNSPDKLKKARTLSDNIIFEKIDL